MKYYPGEYSNCVTVTHIQLSFMQMVNIKDAALSFLMIFTLQGVSVAHSSGLFEKYTKPPLSVSQGQATTKFHRKSNIIIQN